MLEAIPAALSRLKRHQLDMLCSVLQEAHAHFVTCLDKEIEPSDNCDYNSKAEVSKEKSKLTDRLPYFVDAKSSKFSSGAIHIDFNAKTNVILA